MGWLYGEEIIIPELGPHKYQKRFECDTVACKHCGGVIKIVIRGPCSKEPETKFRCGRCDGPICRFCAEEMHRAGGECTGSIKAKIDAAWAAQDGNLIRTYRHTYR